MQRFRASTNCQSFDFRRGEDAQIQHSGWCSHTSALLSRDRHRTEIPHCKQSAYKWLLASTGIYGVEYTATSNNSKTCGTCIALVAGCTSYTLMAGNIRRMQYGLHGKKSRVLLVGLLVWMGGSAECLVWAGTADAAPCVNRLYPPYQFPPPPLHLSSNTEYVQVLDILQKNQNQIQGE